MICLSSAGSLTPFDGELHKYDRAVNVSARRHERARGVYTSAYTPRTTLRPKRTSIQRRLPTHARATSCSDEDRGMYTRDPPPATMTDVQTHARPSTPAEETRTSLTGRTHAQGHDKHKPRAPKGTRARAPSQPATRSPPHHFNRCARSKPRRAIAHTRATITSGRTRARTTTTMGSRARRAEARWKLRSKECASRRNLKAPYAFKGLMIH